MVQSSTAMTAAKSQLSKKGRVLMDLDQGRAIRLEGILQRLRDAREAFRPLGMAVESPCQSLEIGIAGLDRDFGNSASHHVTGDLAQRVVVPQQDRQRQAKFGCGRHLLHCEQEAGVAGERHNGAVWFGNLGTDGCGQGIAEGAGR